MESYANTLYKCIEYIEDNLFYDINLENLAKEVGYSKYHLSRIFNSKMGMAITDYISTRRLSEAAILLKNSRDSIMDIGFKCGYNSDDYFIKKFKEEFSITPHKYRTDEKYITITKKYNIKGENLMKFDSIHNLVTHLFKASKNKEDFVNLVLKIKNCIITKIDNTDVELIVVLCKENFEELQVIDLNMMSGEYRNRRLFKTIESDVHMINLAKDDQKVIFEFISDENPNKIVSAEILAKTCLKTTFSMEVLENE